MNEAKMLLELGYSPPPPRQGLAAPALDHGQTVGEQFAWDSDLDGYVYAGRRAPKSK